MFSRYFSERAESLAPISGLATEAFSTEPEPLNERRHDRACVSHVRHEVPSVPKTRRGRPAERVRNTLRDRSLPWTASARGESCLGGKLGTDNATALQSMAEAPMSAWTASSHPEPATIWRVASRLPKGSWLAGFAWYHSGPR